ncbi:MAG TPA: hypothetical protein ENK85_10130 [Saprospiraceae bacterium]|nr:hypothetical protein [Saprospiraceae bacterium]
MQNLFTFLLVMAISVSAMAQDVSQSQMAMSEGINNAYTISIDEPIKFTKSVWKEYIGAFGKVKKNKQKEQVSLGTSIADLASRPVDLFATFEKMGKDATLVHVWIKTEDGYFSKENEAQDERAISFLNEFKKEVARTKVRKELKEAEKTLKKQDSELTKLIKNNERLHKNIKNYKNKIQKATEDIEKNEKEQKAAKEDLEKQKKVLEEIKQRLEEI